jgi:hypothetical protein
MNYQNHLYMTLHPNASLIASQYNPEQFGSHYMSGSTRHYNGKVIFAELDSKFRHSYFNIEKSLEKLVPHDDGTPKATKFISTYRVMEHVYFDAIQTLYLTTPSGVVLKLNSEPYDKSHGTDFLRIFAEINPIRMLVLTRMSFPEFGQYITKPDNPKGVPKIFYTQIDLDIDAFMRDIEDNPFLSIPMPSLHPSKLKKAVNEMRNIPDKKTKGLSLESNLNRKSYKYIRHGFMFASQGETKFFPMPSIEVIEDTNYKFWRDM